MTKKNTKHKRRAISPVDVNQNQPPGIPRRFKNISGQGDVLFLRVEKIPADAVKVKLNTEVGGYIVAHSESGHHHVLEAERTDFLSVFKDVSGKLFAEVKEGSKAFLKHNKTHPTAHEPIEVPAGSFEIKRAQEYTPLGMRRVTD